MRKSFGILPLILLVSIYGSCKKTTEVKDETKRSNQELLMDAKWVMVANTVYPALGGNTDMYSQYPACSKDDTLFFKKDSLLIWHNGALKCNPNDSAYTEMEWYFLNDSTFNMGPVDYKLRSIDDRNLILNSTQKIGSVIYTYTATFNNKK